MKKSNYVGIALIVLGVIALVKGHTGLNLKYSENIPADQRILESTILGNTMAIGYRNTGVILIALGMVVLSMNID